MTTKTAPMYWYRDEVGSRRGIALSAAKNQNARPIERLTQSHAGTRPSERSRRAAAITARTRSTRPTVSESISPSPPNAASPRSAEMLEAKPSTT